MEEALFAMDFENRLAVAEASKRLNQSSVPVPRPYKNSVEVLMFWQGYLTFINNMQSKKNPESGFISTKTTILSGDIHSCFTPLEELKPIRLREMKVPMVHKGRYLVCKVAAQPSPMVGVNILVYDLNDDIEEAILYNFHYKLDNLDWVSPGTILVIKEPRLRYGSRKEIVTLRIDSPSDVIFVDPTDEEFLKKIGAMKWYESMSKDAEVWKQKANECFKKGNFEKALFLYDRAIRCNPELAVLYLNKSMTCLKLGAFYKAYEAAKIGLEKGGDREKAFYRLGQAAYGLREWQKAANHYVEVLKEFPKNADASAELKRATSRLNEQQNGKYNYIRMFTDDKKVKPNLDVADYKGPIEISNIPGKGRGIIAKADIKNGTLLAVSKAFATGYECDFPGEVDSTNMIRKRSVPASQMLQIIRTMEVLQNNPTRGKELYDLYAGDMEPVDGEIPFGVIDAARIQLISAYNVFLGDYLDKNGHVDIANTLGKNDDTHLFTLPSYFNHACIANADRDFYGDVMVIHASADIKKGEEICLTYVSPLSTFSERKEKLNGWNFACHCKLCEIDANDKFDTKRNRMLDEFWECIEASSSTDLIAKGEPTLKKIRETYVNRKELQIVLAQMLIVLGKRYFDNGNTSKCIQYLEEVVTLFDNPLIQSIVIAYARVNLSLCYLSQGNAAKFHENIKAAMTLRYCTDMDYFKLLYPEIAQYLP